MINLLRQSGLLRSFLKDKLCPAECRKNPSEYLNNFLMTGDTTLSVKRLKKNSLSKLPLRILDWYNDIKH